MDSNNLLALQNELAALRDRIEYLEKLLSLNEPPAHSLLCAFCRGTHLIRLCEYYRFLQVEDRWRVAKKLGLCYRCLDNSDGHLGKDCPKTRICRIRMCRLLHDRLLHDPERRKLRAGRYHATNPCQHSCKNIENVMSDFGNRSDDSEVNGPPCVRSMNSLDSCDDIDN